MANLSQILEQVDAQAWGLSAPLGDGLRVPPGGERQREFSDLPKVS